MKFPSSKSGSVLRHRNLVFSDLHALRYYWWLGYTGIGWVSHRIWLGIVFSYKMQFLHNKFLHASQPIPREVLWHEEGSLGLRLDFWECVCCRVFIILFDIGLFIQRDHWAFPHQFVRFWKICGKRMGGIVLFFFCFHRFYGRTKNYS